MATYFVASGGSNTSPYDTWAKAATSLATALAAATSNNDVVVIQYNAVPSGDAELSVDTTYTFAANIALISASNDGGSSYTPTAMGTSYWIGNSTTNRAILFSGIDRKVFVYGITLRVSGSSVDDINIGSIDSSYVFSSCLFWLANTNTGAEIAVSASGDCYLQCINCTFRFGSTSQNFGGVQGTAEFINCTIDSAGSSPNTLYSTSANTGTARFVGCDLSRVTGTLVSDCDERQDVIFERCKLGAGVVPLAAQTINPTLASAQVWLLDCSSGDTHGLFGHYNALGQCVSSTSVYYTSGAAGQSWKIDTTANACVQTPYRSPFIDWYNSGTSAITPYIEILRDGSTAAYKNHEVWIELMAKTTAGSTAASLYTDAASTLAMVTAGGSNQDAGAGLGSWTGESGTAWSGKCGLASSITPAETGALTARIVFAVPSATVYVDPQIRT